MFRNNNRGSARQWDALRVYYLLEGASSVFFQLVMIIYVIYYATSAGLDPFQIVLAGTVFETTIFLFEIPTGVVADIYSRRLSVIAGFALIGLAWVMMGLLPTFGAILLSEVIQGIGSTFLSGATEAWISDEIGVERAGKAFVRAGQIRTIGAMVGIVLSVALASIALNLPFLVAGVLLVGLSVFLWVVMPENGFQPLPKTGRRSWHSLFNTFREGLRLVRLRRVLIPILIIEFIYAFHSEGFDHLWQNHMLSDFILPVLGTLKPIVWFGIIGLGANLLSIGLSEGVRRRVNLNDHAKTAQALMLVYSLVCVGIVIFSLAGDFAVAIAAYWWVAALRSVGEPISKAWLNQSVEPGIRATLFSMRGQIGALGEIVGGPPIGAIGKAYSLRTSLIASGLALALTLPFFAAMLRRGREAQSVVSETSA